ncbi:MAG TPA: hypothetical protein VFV72_11620 [Candidatus Limnocylindrales bacterium]|nr:hypothetical protein [Candidatus Limnocylindrales bacterium]
MITSANVAPAAIDASPDAAKRAALVRYFGNEGKDRETSHEMYADDAILEFPQSGERFFGKRTIQEWRERYPAKTDFRLRRLSGAGDVWSAEILISYEGRAPMYGVGLYEFRGGKVVREAVYVMDGFDAQEWRAPWATRFDPLASIAPAEWRDGVPFGLEADLIASDQTKT